MIINTVVPTDLHFSFEASQERKAHPTIHIRNMIEEILNTPEDVDYEWNFIDARKSPHVFDNNNNNNNNTDRMALVFITHYYEKCDSCLEKIVCSQMFRAAHPCNHAYCLQCMSRWITSHIKEKKMELLKCPGTCKLALNDEYEIKEVLKNTRESDWNELFEQYCKQKRIVEMMQKPGFQ